MRGSTYRLPGVILVDHEFSIPLDHAQPDGEKVVVFAREAVAPARVGDDPPWLIFFQGGPGHESPRLTGRDFWLARALKDYRVLLLDQRGTGRSTPLNARTLARFAGAQAQADHLAHFRADSIVADAEWIRRDLVGADTQWSLLGQSYGGFCITTYLSFAPEGVREAFLTGGLPPLDATPDAIYRALFPRVLDKNRAYFARYPHDRERVRQIVEGLRSATVTLPGGDPLTAHRFLCLGIAFGMSDGYERVHYVLEEAYAQTRDRPVFTDRFLSAVEAATGFSANPLYAILHESIYCEGRSSRWAAERVRAEFPEFDPDITGDLNFSGEMIFPWMFAEQKALQPLGDAANVLAEREDWAPLYDSTRLAANVAPAAAVVYHDDMYVDANFSLATARAIPGMRTWVTNEYEHDGSRRDGERVLDRLIDMARGDR